MAYVIMAYICKIRQTCDGVESSGLNLAHLVEISGVCNCHVDQVGHIYTFIRRGDISSRCSKKIQIPLLKINEEN